MRHILSLVPMLLLLCIAVVVLAADAPLNKVGNATLKAVQFGPDGKEIGKLAELLDSNAGTRWIYRATEAPEKYLPLRLVFDMGTARTVGKVRLANYFTGANFERGFKSVDLFVGDAQLPAADAKPAVANAQMTMSTKDGAAWTEIPLPQPVKGRYVLLRVNSNWGGNAFAANEVEIYTVEADAPATPTTETPAPDKQPAAMDKISITQYDVAGKVVGTPKELLDKDLATRWNYLPTGKPEEVLPIRLCIDLGAPQTITRVRIANYCSPSHANFDRGIKTVDIFVGDALAPIKDGTPAVADARIAISDANGPVWTNIDLPKPVQGRFITLRVKENWGGKNFAANEMEIVTAPAEGGK